MSTYKLTLEYDGTSFSGWQRQPQRRTVAGVLEQALAALGEGAAATTAAGRTDAGAHAHGQVAGVTLQRDWPTQTLRRALNARLPRDAVVVDAQPAAPCFHARHDALLRTYRYLVAVRDERAPVTGRHAWVVRGPLDVSAMHQAAQLLLGRHDFGAFGRPSWRGGSTVRTVHTAGVEAVSLQASGVSRLDGAVLTVSADAFLRGMMRAFAGALVELGRGRLDSAGLTKLVDNAPDAARFPVAPAHGLHQWSVLYPAERAA